MAGLQISEDIYPNCLCLLLFRLITLSTSDLCHRSQAFTTLAIFLLAPFSLLNVTLKSLVSGIEHHAVSEVEPIQKTVNWCFLTAHLGLDIMYLSALPRMALTFFFNQSTVEFCGAYSYTVVLNLYARYLVKGLLPSQASPNFGYVLLIFLHFFPI